MIQDLPGIAIVGGGLLMLLVVSELWCRLTRVPPEWPRKLVHVGGGLLCLSLPWMVSSVASVLVLAVVATSLLVAGRCLCQLRGLHGVTRRTLGSEFYPIAVFLTYVVSEGQAWLYLCGMLVLALADAGAALIGTRHGRLRYSVEDSEKSLEGSLAFFIITMIVVSAPVLLMTDHPVPMALAAAATVGLLVTGLEAISLSGTDNIFVPVCVCVILSKTLSHPLAWALYQLGGLAGITTIIGVLAWRVRMFNTGGTLAFVLFAFAAWSMGSELWSLPLLPAFVLYAVVWHRCPFPVQDVRVRLVFRAVLVPLVLLVVGNMFDCGDMLIIPFLGTCAFVLAATLWNHLREGNGWARQDGRIRLWRGMLLGVMASWVMLPGPAVVLSSFTALDAMVICVIVSAANGVSARLQRQGDDRTHAWDALQLLLAALCAAILVCWEVLWAML